MIDFRMPEPLLDPRRWPKVNQNVTWLFSLDILCSSGGPLRGFFEAILAEPQAQVIWYLSKNRRYSELPEQQISRWFKSESVRQITGDQSAVRSFGETLSGLGIQTVQISMNLPRAPEVFDWARAIDPELSSVATEQASRRNLKAYMHHMPSDEEPSWQSLRYFSGFLRQMGFKADAERFHRQWSLAAAFFSPQSEHALILKPNEVMLNPTAQILRSPAGTEARVEVIFRRDNEIELAGVGISEAALLDELLEEGRCDRFALLRAAERVLPGQTLDLALARLISLRVVLDYDNSKRAHSASSASLV